MIRPIEEKDLDFLVAIEIKDEGISDPIEKPLEEHQKRVQLFIEGKDFGGFIYEKNKKTVACIMFSIENINKDYAWPTIYNEINKSYFDDSGDILCVYQLWVDPDHRRQGIASQLKLSLEDEASRREINIIYTHTETHNQHVIRMNQQLNYKVVRIGPIWDEILRVSLIKDIREQSSNRMLQIAQSNKCLISADELKNLMQIKSLQLLDIRYFEDFEVGHIEGSFNCHWFQVHKIIKQLKKNTEVIVICYTGQSSMHVATLLTSLGYKAYSLLDGMAKWPYHVK